MCIYIYIYICMYIYIYICRYTCMYSPWPSASSGWSSGRERFVFSIITRQFEFVFTIENLAWVVAWVVVRARAKGDGTCCFHC